MVKGWKKLKKGCEYINEFTGQTLIITQKRYSNNYYALIFVAQRTEDKDGRVISPEFPSATKAETYAINLMTKHPNGIITKL